MAIKLGSTLNDFINAVNNTAQETTDIVNGDKPLKKVLIGNSGSITEEDTENQDEKVTQMSGSIVSLSSAFVNDRNIVEVSKNAVNLTSVHARNPESIISKASIQLNSKGVDEGNLPIIDIIAQGGDIKINGSKIFFEGNVDFLNANVTNFPISGGGGSGGLDISPAIIEYDNDRNILIINSPDNVQIETVNGKTTLLGKTFSLRSESENGDIARIYCGEGLIEISADNDVKFYGNIDFSEANVIGLPSGGGGGSIDTDDNFEWNGDHIFNGNVTFNGTLNGFIEFPNAGYIDVGDDYVEINHPQLTLSSDQLYLYANQSENSVIEILVGENDETSFYISPTGMEVTANNGSVDFKSSNGINFTTGADGLTWFNLYEDEQSSYFNIDLNDGLSILRFSCDKETEETSFYCDANTINFANTQRVNVGNELNIGVRGAKIADEGYLTVRDNENLYLITEDEEGNASYIDMYTYNIEYASASHTFNGNAQFNNNVKFLGEVDLSEANVTGLPSGGSGGKTKITLAELRSMLTNNATNYGKLIQFVYKGSNANALLQYALNSFGLVQITKGLNTIYAGGSHTGVTQSAIEGSKYTLYIDNNNARINYETWDYDIANATTNIYDSEEINITDDLFDIYVIGG